jgi:hypothetical protein
MTSRWRIAPLGFLGLLALWAPRCSASGTGDAVVSAATERTAPEFPRTDAAGWINSEPLMMRALRGQVVVLDIWTFG